PHVVLAARGPDLRQLLLHAPQQLQRRREHGDLLPLEELLHPPVGIIGRLHSGNGLALALELVELARILRLPDELLDPDLPRLVRRLLPGHGADATSAARIRVSSAPCPHPRSTGPPSTAASRSAAATSSPASSTFS